jgi:hypothetical protein
MTNPSSIMRVQELRSKILRPTDFLDIEADRNWEGVRRLNFK